MAQAPDPYAASVAQAARARLQASYEEFLNGVRTYSYAIACGALPLKSLAYGAIAQKRFYFVNKLEPFEAMEKTINQILADGPGVARDKGCEFWSSNPDAVLEVRQAALAGRMP
ncbi:hypothetical protein [Methylobacterium brachiatum]|uniref:hypothetical protein n=1 Tax=Methylobacterium brachiatum TaxID=269660 RepID=UPI0013CE5EAE|nr:hypothetical protein [Methylobacterium brachiatum]